MKAKQERKWFCSIMSNEIWVSPSEMKRMIEKGTIKWDQSHWILDYPHKRRAILLQRFLGARATLEDFDREYVQDLNEKKPGQKL